MSFHLIDSFCRTHTKYDHEISEYCRSEGLDADYVLLQSAENKRKNSYLRIRLKRHQGCNENTGKFSGSKTSNGY